MDNRGEGEEKDRATDRERSVYELGDFSLNGGGSERFKKWAEFRVLPLFCFSFFPFKELLEMVKRLYHVTSI